jgi:hypothetical protein
MEAIDPFMSDHAIIELVEKLKSKDVFFSYSSYNELEVILKYRNAIPDSILNYYHIHENDIEKEVDRIGKDVVHLVISRVNHALPFFKPPNVNVFAPVGEERDIILLDVVKTPHLLEWIIFEAPSDANIRMKLRELYHK